MSNPIQPIHPNCNRCGAAPQLQTSGPKARAKWARVQCSNYDECGMQTPQIKATTATGLELAKGAAWARWDRKA